MADYTITPSNVIPISGSPTRRLAAEAIDAGEAYYLDSNNQARLADADAGTTSPAQTSGIAVNSAVAAGQYVDGLESGTIDIGTGTQGDAVFLSGTPGKLMPHTDLAGKASGFRVSYVGTINASQELVLGIHNPDIAKP